MATRFKSLDGLGGFLHAVGIVVVILGSLVASVGVLALANAMGSSSSSLALAIGAAVPTLGIGGAVVLYGFFIAAFGQTMKCLVAIEENTRLALEGAQARPALAGGAGAAGAVAASDGGVKCPDCQAVNYQNLEQCFKCGRSLVSM